MLQYSLVSFIITNENVLVVSPKLLLSIGFFLILKKYSNLTHKQIKTNHKIRKWNILEYIVLIIKYHKSSDNFFLISILKKRVCVFFFFFSHVPHKLTRTLVSCQEQ